MNNEELRVKQQEVLEQYKRNIDAQPDVKKWISHKKILCLIAIIFIATYYVVEYLAYNSVNAEINVRRLAIKAIFAILWMSLFLFPTAAWKVNLIFYASAIWNFVSLFRMDFNQREISAYFQNGPLIAIFFIMSVAIPILLLVLACWLTIPKRNRELADRAQRINQEYMDSIKQIGK